MLVRHRRDLRKVCNRNNLMALPKARHLLAYRSRNFATHIRIDFIENHQRGRILICERVFDSKHNPRNFAT